MWRKKLLQLEKEIDLSNYTERDFDIWFVSRYFLTETIRLRENKFTTMTLSKPLKYPVTLNLSHLSFIWRLRKNKAWIFPHSRTIDPITAKDRYVYPHLSELEISEAINVGYNSRKTLNLNAIVRFAANFLKVLFFRSIQKFDNNILPIYARSFNLNYERLNEVSNHALHQYAMYKIYNFILIVFSPSIVHFSDRSDKFPLILACRKQKVQMIEYQHGLPLEFKFNYDFGDFNKNLFSHITFKYHFQNRRYADVLSRLGMNLSLANKSLMQLKSHSKKKKPKPKNIMIVMQSEFFKIISEIDFDRYSFATFFIKPHPSEEEGQYLHLRNFQNVEILSPASEVFYEYLPSVDVVIGFYSTALVESSILNKRCIAISDFDELTKQMVDIFNIKQINMEGLISEMDSWHS